MNEGERTLIVDDILTTGGSVSEVVNLVKEYKGQIIGIGVLLDRSGGKVRFDYPLKALAIVEAKTYEPDNCPLCEEKVPLVKPGSKKIDLL